MNSDNTYSLNAEIYDLPYHFDGQTWTRTPLDSEEPQIAYLGDRILEKLNSPEVRNRVSGAIPLYNQAERMMSVVAGGDWKIVDAGREPIVDGFEA